jgi:hypothetical protein
MQRTSIDVKVTYGAQWLTGDLILDNDGSPVVVLRDETESLGPDDVFFIRSDGETDAIVLDAAWDAGFNVVEG